MASAITTINNIKGVIMKEDTNSERLIAKRTPWGGHEHVITHDRPWCCYSEQWVEENEICRVERVFILNEHIVQKQEYFQCADDSGPTLNKGHVVEVKKKLQEDGSVRSIHFIFNIDDIRKQRIMAFYMANHERRQHDLPFLPTEIINKIVEDYPKCFPYNCESSYKGHIPNRISRAELKILYEMGIVKMGFHLRKHHKTPQGDRKKIVVLSDESFDYISPDGNKKLEVVFYHKETMRMHIEVMMERYF